MAEYRIVKGGGDRPWKVKLGRTTVATSTSKAKAKRHVGYRTEAEKKRDADKS